MILRCVGQNLYVSGHTKGLQAKHSKELLDLGEIGYVINVSPREDKPLRELMPDRYFHFPLKDSDRNDPAVVRRLGEFVNRIRTSNHKVLIHCNAGRNRSCFIAGLALLYQEKISGASAVEHIRNVRPEALANLYFEKFLLEESCPTSPTSFLPAEGSIEELSHLIISRPRVSSTEPQ